MSNTESLSTIVLNPKESPRFQPGQPAQNANPPRPNSSHLGMRAAQKANEYSAISSLQV